MSIRTGMNRIALSLGRFAYKNGVTKRTAKVQAGDFFHGILLDNDPPMEFYSRTSIPVYIHSPSPSIVGEQWKYQKKKTKEIMADMMNLANTLPIELTRREISFFKSYLLPLLPDSFIGVVLRFPEENEAGTDCNLAKRLNDIRQSDEVQEHVLTNDLVRKINLLLSLNCPSC